MTGPRTGCLLDVCARAPGCAKSSLCPRRGFDVGDGSDFGESLRGWGNWQRQCHTNNSNNARVESMPNNPKDGMLVIQVAQGTVPAPGQSAHFQRHTA